MALIELVSWKTEDGKIFQDKNEAIKHHAKIMFKNKLIGFIEKFGFNGMTKSDVFDMIFQERNELFNILNEER